jgi:CPA2 family monovalent cation:H+ antiporter-2
VDTPHGHLSVGVLLFQDICVVLMVMVIQTMGGSAAGSPLQVMKGLGISVVAFAIIIAVVGFLIPRVFHHVVKIRNREVFILTILLVCLGTAWMSASFGLSLAMGAFIAGLALSESEYANQIVTEVIPFRDTFASLFFISIGMFLDVSYFINNVVMVLLLVLAIMVLKALVVMAVGVVLKYPPRLSIVVGLTLAQIGEFSFILIKMGEGYGLLTHDLYQTLLAATILSMAATPFVFQQSSKAAMKAGRYIVKGKVGEDFKKKGLSNHVIIVGYGVNGQNLARVLLETAIEHVVLDVNISKVRQAREAGHSAFYGDASHPEILKKMSIEKAKMLVVAISDPISTRRIVKSSRELNPSFSILVRTRYVKEVEDLYKLGADQVIPEEFETSVEIFARVLRDYRTPGNIIQNQIDLIRQEGYAMLRNPSLSSDRVDSLVNILEASLMDTYYVDSGCAIAGQTVGEMDLRKKTGTSIIAVIRKGVARTNPGIGFTIELGDIMVLLGSHAELNSAFVLLKEICPTEER